MPIEPTSSESVMEGKGAYNKYAKLPAGGAALALPLLERAARNLEVDAGDHPVVIADYGSSQGKNSMIPMQRAVKGLRNRIGPNRAIAVFHIDQPSNDFNSLFGILDADPDRYSLNDSNVFPAAIGRSFYENVLPPGSVYLGWSSYAAVWLSRVPALIPGHFFSPHSTGSVRAKFDHQGAQDWEVFLSLRAKELRVGGRLIVVLPALADDGLSGFENIMDQANAVLAEMVTAGSIKAEDRAQMVLRSHLRRKRDLLAPFAGEARFQQLTVEDLDTSVLPDAAWTDFERDGDREGLAAKHASFFRSVFAPALASALAQVRSGDPEALHLFGDRLEAGLKRRLASQPAPMHSLVQSLVLTKQV